MKTCYGCFALHKYNLNTYTMPHTVIKFRYRNVKNHSEISRYFSVHVLPHPLRNSKELAKFYHFKLPWRLPGQWKSGIILGMGSASETGRYSVVSHWLSQYPEWSLKIFKIQAHYDAVLLYEIVKKKVWHIFIFVAVMLCFKIDCH